MNMAEETISEQLSKMSGDEKMKLYQSYEISVNHGHAKDLPVTLFGLAVGSELEDKQSHTFTLDKLFNNFTGELGIRHKKEHMLIVLENILAQLRTDSNSLKTQIELIDRRVSKGIPREAAVGSFKQVAEQHTTQLKESLRTAEMSYFALLEAVNKSDSHNTDTRVGSLLQLLNQELSIAKATLSKGIELSF